MSTRRTYMANGDNVSRFCDGMILLLLPVTHLNIIFHILLHVKLYCSCGNNSLLDVVSVTTLLLSLFTVVYVDMQLDSFIKLRLVKFHYCTSSI